MVAHNLVLQRRIGLGIYLVKANRAMTSFTLVGHSADFTLSVPIQRA